MWVRQCHLHNPPVIIINIGGMFTILSNYSQSWLVYGIVLPTLWMIRFASHVWFAGFDSSILSCPEEPMISGGFLEAEGGRWSTTGCTGDQPCRTQDKWWKIQGDRYGHILYVYIIIYIIHKMIMIIILMIIIIIIYNIYIILYIYILLLYIYMLYRIIYIYI